MRHPRAPGGSNAEEIVRHSEESERLDKEPAINKERCEPGSMLDKLPACEYRIVTRAGKLNVCQAGVYGGQVTAGMCRMCLQRGDKPAAIVQLPKIRLGDAVESMLAGIGITKDLVYRITRKPCACKARQKWLNQWGHDRIQQAERVLNKAARWYGIS